MDRKPDNEVGEVPSDQDQHPFIHILEPDGFTCRLCGSQRSLEIHHIRLRPLGGSHSDAHLITVC